MLTSETKRHIDAARQVLVGVVPNPAEQINQITNALIYKFMDDMDQSAVKAGGEPSFFIGKLERYAWTRLMDSRIGNQERMNLYSEALMKFSESEQLPQLFRDIFKSAFLPYRSPEVLGLFLQEISYFDYSHSEELGNAYEYLLSIMSSQGDAGQFRTPRHIIDFIVAVVNPTKDDKILDPACGTAGFLISAYKHIIEQHDGKNADGSKNFEKPLTPDERRALLGNFEGYDIDPNMVRIAQVNMYLHQFKNPKIFSYNTLSDEDRWKDKFDIILANPPFMSPKGGVSTHNKFSIDSSRSEVLFVDYIMNHLRPKGRAGVIVPEGIIFQSGKGHTQLRKNLIADGLWAVVSLPSGVFNPYSGVKTSVLLFDNEHAKKNTEIAFIKIINDGFDLGANKKPVNKNDLPKALEILKRWRDSEKTEQEMVTYVDKSKFSDENDFNLSADRYRILIDHSSAKWKMTPLGEIFEPSGKRKIEGETHAPIMSITMSKGLIDQDEKFKKRIASVDISTYKKVFKNELVIGFPIDEGVLGFQRKYEFAAVSPAYEIWKIRPEVIVDINYLELLLRSESMRGIYSQNMQGAVSRRRTIPRDLFFTLKIPLPPLEVQQQIVEELAGYQKIISGAHQVVENWKPRFEIDPEWEKVRLGGLCQIKTGKKDVNEGNPEGKYPFFTCAKENTFSDVFSFDTEALLIAGNGDVGAVKYFKGKFEAYQRTYVLSDFEKVLPMYLYFYLETELKPVVSAQKLGNTMPYIKLGMLSEFPIPLPSIEIQKQIVEKIEAERVLVNGNKKLMEIYEQKTKQALAKLWTV